MRMSCWVPLRPHQPQEMARSPYTVCLAMPEFACHLSPCSRSSPPGFVSFIGSAAPASMGALYFLIPTPKHIGACGNPVVQRSYHSIATVLHAHPDCLQASAGACCLLRSAVNLSSSDP